MNCKKDNGDKNGKYLADFVMFGEQVQMEQAPAPSNIVWENIEITNF